MHRSDNRILTTHTGSLPRPPELVALFCARNEGGTADIVWAKIRSLRDGAKLATERLFGAKA
jgi:hypothetical protein